MTIQKLEHLLDKKYGIAETFTSWQGEGLYTGTRMHFIRFSGCSVGKKLTDEERVQYLLANDPESQRTGFAVYGNLPVYREKCTLYDDRTFLCDTNFQTSKAMSVRELVEEIPEGVLHVCLTGGEPMDRDLSPLLKVLDELSMTVHIETSGTVPIGNMLFELSIPDIMEMDDNENGWLWITVSPKKGVSLFYQEHASEIKLLVDEHFDESKLPELILAHPLVWLQPVNYEHETNKENVKRCLAILQNHPDWRMSMQMHKLWNVR